MAIDRKDLFFIDNMAMIDELIDYKNKFMRKMFNRVSELKEMIEKPDGCEEQSIYAKSCLFHNFNLSGHSIAFDLYITSQGWELTLFDRNDESQLYLSKLITESPLWKEYTVILNNDSRYILETFGLKTDLNTIKSRLLYWIGLLINSNHALANTKVIT